MPSILDVVAESERMDTGKPYVEIITRHSLLQGQFSFALGTWAKGRGVALVECRFWLSADADRPTSLVPDASFVSFERIAPLDEDERQYMPFAPDIAVEIRSPEDRERKIALYLVYGARCVIDVDPVRAMILAIDANGRRLFRRGGRFSHERMPEFGFGVSEYFDSGEIRLPR